MEEIWKEAYNTDGLYSVSTLGRIMNNKKGIIITPKTKRDGYYYVYVKYGGRRCNRSLHTMITETFLGYRIGVEDLVTDHINNIRTDNRLCNLQLLTNRENCSKDRINKSSKYTGVSWSKKRGKWIATIQLFGVSKYLGAYDNEDDAKKRYDNMLKWYNRIV